jgi:hypothetical protein
MEVKMRIYAPEWILDAVSVQGLETVLTLPGYQESIDHWKENPWARPYFDYEFDMAQEVHKWNVRILGRFLETGDRRLRFFNLWGILKHDLSIE